MGKKPLYYAQSKSGMFIFASELKAIKPLAHAISFPLEIEQQSIYDYLSLGTIPQPATIYKNVSMLEAGCYLKVSNSKIHTKKYWAINREPKLEISYEEALVKTEQLLQESISLRLRSDVPLGILLSGGLDSSIIAYEAAKVIGPSLQCFTIGMNDSQFDEVPVAKRTAERLGLKIHTLSMNVVPQNEIMNVVKQYDQPFADSSAIPSMVVSRMAGEHVKVVLNGDGADEVFAGYRRYIASRQLDKWATLFPGSLAREISGITERININRRSKLGFLLRFIRGLGHSPSERYIAWSSDLLLDSEKRPIWLGNTKVSSTETKIEEIFSMGSSYSFLDQQLELDRNFNLLGLLVKMDIATMAASIEGRSPFLDHKLVEFASRLPDHYKIGRTFGKKILRDLYKGKLNDEVLWGPKRGFEVPLAKWLEYDLKELLQDVLLRSNAYVYQYIDRSWVNALLEGKEMHNRNWAFQVYSLLMLELWLANEAVS